MTKAFYRQAPGCNGNTIPPSPLDGPCEKTQSMLQSIQVVNKVDSLKTAANANGNEFAFKIRADGTTSNMEEGEKEHVNMSSMSGFVGFYHCHPGLGGINIFSPPDIKTLFNGIMTGGTASTVSDIFFGVVGSEVCVSCPGGIKYFHYIVRFTGTLQEAGAVFNTNYDMKILREDYTNRENKLTSILPTSPYSDNDGTSLNHKGVEKLFYDTLDKMNIPKNKMILQRVNDDNTIDNITPNPDGTTTALPCP